MLFGSYDTAPIFKIWRVELMLNKKWFFGYEVYPTGTGGSFLCLYLIPLFTVRVRVGKRSGS